jgi:gas vesicle protein
VGQEPDRIRAEIEQTRADMSETVDALGHKADVKTRAKENLQAKKESVVGVKDKGLQAAGVAQENPIGLALGSLAVGFIAGMLMPSTRMEDEKMGEVSDSVMEKVKETGQEALEHGKQVAQDAAETVKESGQEHGQQVKESAKQSAQEATPSSSPTYQTHS